jgi:hypothetical protein
MISITITTVLIAFETNYRCDPEVGFDHMIIYVRAQYADT